MDINTHTNTLQPKAAVGTPLRLVNVKQSVTAVPLESTATVAEARDIKHADELQQAVTQLNDYVQNIQRNLQFSVDKESGAMVVKVIDTKSAKVIRQIPTEESLRMARSLVEHNVEAAFNIFNSKA
jgi:flagellar protein FlaG